VILVFLDQQPQEKAADEVREAEDGNNEPKQVQTSEKQMYEGEAENISSHSQSPECRAFSQAINGEVDEEDEEDEEPRPVKRRKRNSRLTRYTPVHIE
jgi:hypothetical protein